MRGFFRDSGHLVRPAIVLLAGLAVFFAIRNAVVPKAFGQYGHYRPAALEANRQHQVAFAGQAQCAMCHVDQAAARAAGPHAHVSCEACHGPQAKHAGSDDPVSSKPPLPEVATLCVRCHEKDAARPKGFPQVVSAEHSAGVVCNTCHQPHNPHI